MFKSKFLYRITDINGSSIKYLNNLKDGTLYIETLNNNSYIIKIIEDKGYQILYNIEIRGKKEFFHDEKILSNDIGYNSITLALFEKDNNGIYKKTIEKVVNDVVYYFIQVRENIMASNNMDYIFFYEINTLNLLNKINYCGRSNRLALLNENYLIVCSISGSLNRFNLIEIDTREFIRYFCSDEEEYIKNPSSKSCIHEDIKDSYNLPDGSVVLKMISAINVFKNSPNYYYYSVHWDEKKK